ncbi:rod shape-determining protein MreD [Parabacteroides sp. PF5-5]|uniref:rod shape-determining protein MreD n=1 Tax=unclassified Parabacteroides TaxID=2649774 RepID=UPI002475312E|nr:MULTISPECIES: rod shape-determining protein MreD [unclassified Parabacteroides]MDH6305478.1 rod shape-determining protein MreD [Parabacteroides sp. PH5-39]MDH6316188.1 rod shape-determining protein MreD [Parabacteroides sp. PF5-13]MDH6320338.1 rod shape-determining protein MreD [Parabacteroides sp. PH5-13]MDH6324068.1 rod shape-determining protein MreD [Parabacteroides sp. PH5-8]MDH6327379.1 rod shape-determining protein MreD [Parabacteroides sp. PH5-41]
MINIVKGSIYFVVLVLVQVLILNNIHFLRLATPFLYIYFILKLPIGFTSTRVTFFSFLIGLVIDIFSNTPGMHAATCTLVGFARMPILKIIIKDEMQESLSPSLHAFGFGGFLRYVLALVVLHHVTLFLLESLTLFDPLFLLIRIVASIVTTTLLVCIVEAFNIDAKRNAD